MRRAAVSIPANIAEGFRKRGKADKARFMNTAEGSVEESRYYLILAQALGYGETRSLIHTLDEVSRLLNSYAGAILTSNWPTVSASRTLLRARLPVPPERVNLSLCHCQCLPNA